MRTGCKSVVGLSRSEFNKTLLRRFKSKCGAADARGCIPWTGTKTKKGYGILHYGGSDGTLWQKLQAHDVERIRDLRRMGHTQQAIADRFGVSRPLISMIEHGKIQHAQVTQVT